MRLPHRTALALLVALVLPLAAAAAGGSPELEAFRARHGAAWGLETDAVTGRPRRLSGGALPFQASPAALDRRVGLVDLARSFLAETADLLAIDASAWRLAPDGLVEAASGQLVVLHHELAPGGVPVLGSRLTLVVSHGSLIAVHAVGTGVMADDPSPSLGDWEAVERALAAASLERGAVRRPDARLVFVPRAAGARLAWRVVLIERDVPRRRVALVDARDGNVFSLTDETVEACDPVPAGGTRKRVLGGVRPNSATDAERQELLPFVPVGPELAGSDGFFSAPPRPYEASLAGPEVSVSCVSCATPVQPRASAGSDGDVDFGLGGTDAMGNGMSTPSDRTAYFHSELARRHADRWLDLPYLDLPLAVRTNIASSCNAYWDGSGLNFFRSSASCANTGEIRDVIVHEWGHGLDDNDGQPTASLAVDAATGEAVGDISALLHGRDACIGESFHLDPSDGPSATCTGVRDLDELAPGHRRGSPGTLTIDNVAFKCPPSASYRGVLGREGHCEGEILGQAVWHLVQDLLTGTAYGDGSPLGFAPLAQDDAWDLLARLHYLSRPMLASYAPSPLQSIGMSAYEAFLLADDDGTGLGDGTPHAAAIHDAFAHHGIAEAWGPVASSAACVPPADPAVSASGVTDPASGRPGVRLDWNDVGAARYHVLRADDAGRGSFPMSDALPAGTVTFVDLGVLPGRPYFYRIVAEDAAGCVSPGATPIVGSPGALLRVAASRFDDTLGGNGDRVLEAGEDADLELDLANDGSGPATNLSVRLESSDPTVLVLPPDTLAYGTLAPGATAVAPGAWTVRALPGAPRYVELTATGEADEGCLRTSWLLELAVVDLARVGESVAEVVGDGDGAWEPGETVDATITLANAGLLGAAAVDGTLSFRGPPIAGVTIVRNSASWGAIASLGTQDSLAPTFQLAAAPGLGPRTKIPLQLDVSVNGQPHRAFDLSLTVGGFPPGQLEWSAAPGDRQVAMVPLVLQLTDDDNDGVITRCDIPDVISVRDTFPTKTLFAVSGDDGRLLWELTDPLAVPQAFGAIAGGDIDQDGRNEIVVMTADGFITAITWDGQFKWRSGATTQSCTRCTPTKWGAPAIWDVDQDGAAEVISGDSVLRGTDGSLVWEDGTPNNGGVLVFDIDLDGSLELTSGGRTVHRADGSRYPVTLGDMGRHAAIGNFDDDPYPEFVLPWTVGRLTVVNHDGSTHFARNDMPGSRGSQGPPCVGDFDGDGRAELATATERLLVALDDDGTTLWTSDTQDVSGSSGCVVFDFDRDGRPEIVYRDEQFLRVYDGLDGEVLWETPNGSGTAYETPSIADIDGDGSAEIVVGGRLSDGTYLHAYGNPAWAAARAVWNQENYSANHVEEDGSIVAEPFPSWLLDNEFRGQPVVCPCSGPAPDFTRSVPDCGDLTLCFTADVSGGRLPLEFEWDFGDGSPRETGPNPCHAFPAAGDYAVRLEVVDWSTCVADRGRIVRVRDDLAAGFAADLRCVGTPSCFTADAPGGLAPHDHEWDFGDGSPRATGVLACHSFAAGSAVVTHFVRDANGCFVEEALPVVILDPVALPELSGAASGQPLLVSRSGPALALRFEAPAPVGSLYVGDLDELRRTGYTHEALAGCRLSSGSATVPTPAGNRYLLVVASACTPLQDGSYGTDSFGLRRPTAGDLGRATCP